MILQTAQFKKKQLQDRASLNQEIKLNAGKELKAWEKLRDGAAKAPPSEFSTVVLKFEAENYDLSYAQNSRPAFRIQHPPKGDKSARRKNYNNGGRPVRTPQKKRKQNQTENFSVWF